MRTVEVDLVVLGQRELAQVQILDLQTAEQVVLVWYFFAIECTEADEVEN